jgi:hypothetical protein
MFLSFLVLWDFDDLSLMFCFCFCPQGADLLLNLVGPVQQQIDRGSGCEVINSLIREFGFLGECLRQQEAKVGIREFTPPPEADLICKLQALRLETTNLTTATRKKRDDLSILVQDQSLADSLAAGLTECSCKRYVVDSESKNNQRCRAVANHACWSVLQQSKKFDIVRWVGSCESLREAKHLLKSQFSTVTTAEVLVWVDVVAGTEQALDETTARDFTAWLAQDFPTATCLLTGCTPPEAGEDDNQDYDWEHICVEAFEGENVLAGSLHEDIFLLAYDSASSGAQPFSLLDKLPPAEVESVLKGKCFLDLWL